MSAAVRGGPRWARRFLGPVVSVVSLAAVVWWALHQQAPRWPTGTGSLMLIVLAVLVYAAVSMVRGVRWHMILRRAGIPASMADTQALIVVGYMGNTVLPARGGELDGQNFPTLAKHIAETIPGAELVIIPKAGHVPHIQVPEIFNRELLKFLEADSSLSH